MKNTNLLKVLKILLILMTVIPLILIIIFNIILKNAFAVYNSTNFILFLIIELINIMLLIKFVVLKKDISKKTIILITIYLIITALIPIFHTGSTYAPEGPDAYLMGVALKENYRDIYGIDITYFVKIFID